MNDAGDNQRDAIISAIAKHASNVHFIPMPMLTVYKNLIPHEDYPNTYQQYSREISLPVYYDLMDAQGRGYRGGEGHARRWGHEAFDIGFALVLSILLLPLPRSRWVDSAHFSRWCSSVRPEWAGGWEFRLLEVPTMRTGSEARRDTDHRRHMHPRVTMVGYASAARSRMSCRSYGTPIGDSEAPGPRPEVPKYVALYTPEQRGVLDVRPHHRYGEHRHIDENRPVR